MSEWIRRIRKFANFCCGVYFDCMHPIQPMHPVQPLQPQFIPEQFRSMTVPGQVPNYEASLEKKDFFPKIFLIPSEVRLDKQKGLVVIKRTEEHPDKFEQEDVMDIMIENEAEFAPRPSSILREGNRVNPAGHGLISLFKKTNQRKIKLAVCVCVYSQPKHMLKSTIKGIQQSYKHFYQKAGIMSHQIILVVIFDGIEKVNNSKEQTDNMISYFNEFDLKNGFRHKPYGKTVEEYFKEFPDSLENYDDVSVFTEKELEDLRGKLFETQYKEYTRIKKLQEEILELKKNKELKVDQLPLDVLKKYEELCLNYCVENNVACAENRDEIQDYLATKKDVRLKIIIEAVRETELLCHRYLESRQDKSILYPLRVQTADFEDPKKSIFDRDKRKKKKNVQSSPQDKQKQYQYMFFCVKHKNAGKLSSHLLFFEGFCKIFDPQFCILLDVGLKPVGDAIYRMWAYMEKNPKCGGVCGYMQLKVQNPEDDLGYRFDGFQKTELDWLTRTADYFVNIQRAQQFEYHFAHMLDKPFQAFFNYIHVLPGAFSGYRWKALQSIKYDPNSKKKPEETRANTQVRQIRTGGSQNDVNLSLLPQTPEQNTLMRRYLKTAMSQKVQLNLQQSNMYLAEDRVMCLGIHALGYDLAYLPDAESHVDPVTSLTRMMGQRKRWINGSWFAFEYVFRHREKRTSCMFLIQLLYYWIVQRITFVSIGLFYLTMTMTVAAAVDEWVVPAVVRFFRTPDQWALGQYKILGILDVRAIAKSVPDIVNFVYIIAIGSVFFLSLSLNQNNKRFSRVYYLVSSLLGVYGCFIFGLLIYDTVKIFQNILNKKMQGSFIIPTIYLKILIMFILGGHALPVVWTFSFSKWLDMLVALPSFIFYAPTYINILLIYAFCRIDDLSWGTKGLDEDVERKKTLDWKKEKYWFICIFMIANILLAYGICQVLHISKVKGSVILGLTCLTAFLLAFRLVPAGLYLLKYKFKSCCMKFSSETINNNIKNGEQVLRGLRNIEFRIKQIQKHETRQKKEQQFIQLKNSKIFESRSLSNIGAKLRNRITQHIIDNNVIPKKEIVSDRKRYRSKRKILLKKKLNVIEERSNESEDTRNLDTSDFSDKNIDPNRLQVPKMPRLGAGLEKPHNGTDIKARIEKLKRINSQRST